LKVYFFHYFGSRSVQRKDSEDQPSKISPNMIMVESESSRKWNDWEWWMAKKRRRRRSEMKWQRCHFKLIEDHIQISPCQNEALICSMRIWISTEWFGEFFQTRKAVLNLVRRFRF
jgi:hypothetical protein